HTSELQSLTNLECRLLLEKKKVGQIFEQLGDRLRLSRLHANIYPIPHRPDQPERVPPGPARTRPGPRLLRRPPHATPGSGGRKQDPLPPSTARPIPT